MNKTLFVTTLGIFLLLAGCTEEKKYENTAEIYPSDGETALQWLLEGNDRFVNGRSFHQHESSKWRSRLTENQKPFATIIGCSDSRVPVELLFDQGFGDLFIIRVAGNVSGTDELGSLAYSVAHLNTPLVLVMGHEKCGAVAAALLPDSVREEEPPLLQALLSKIDPALEDLDESLSENEKMASAVEMNVYWSINKIRNRLNQFDEYREVLVKGAVYELKTGQVKILK